jgi:hypothetical protein
MNAAEAFNDRLEEHFDKVCSALKGGARSLGEPLVAAGVKLPVDELVQVVNCSLRALKVEPRRKDGAKPIRLLWEIDGRDAKGQFITVRSESPGAVAPKGKTWRLSELDTTGFTRLAFEKRRYQERAAEVGLLMPERTVGRYGADSMVGGLSVRDVDGDAIPDVISLDGPSAWLFRGQPGLAFAAPELISTSPKGVLATCAALGDIDGDGDADLVLTRYPNVPDLVFKNEKGKFVETGTLGKGGLHQSGVFSDFDGDGKLDLAVFNYPLNDRVPSSMIETENGDVPELFFGNGDFTFRPYTWPAKVANKRWSLAAMSTDLLNRGGVQLYVANDYGSNDLYVFAPDGGVSEQAKATGLNDPGNGMSVDVGDVDGDGRLDLYVANMFSKAGTRVIAASPLKGKPRDEIEKFARGNTLYFAQADGGFAERGLELNVNRGLWAYASLLTDVDDDGKLEATVANGYLSHPKRKDL